MNGDGGAAKRPGRTLVAAAAVALALAGAGLGAGLYAALDPGGTTTTVVQTGADPAGGGGGAQPVSSENGLTIHEIYERAHPGVVEVEVRYDFGSDFFHERGSRSAEGSGFVYDTEGHVVTNQHVVANRGELTVTFASGKSYPGRVIGMDRSTDLAVIKVSAPASELHPLELGDSDAVEIGDPVVAIGSPFGLTGTVTSGIVSGLHREMESPSGYSIGNAIQTDAAINHGNSGGPLLDAEGRVIGVNSQIQSEGGGNDGVGFAVPSSTVQEVVPQLIAGKTPQHAYLGVSISESSSPPGVLVSAVAPGGPADDSGMQAGDVITRLAGTAITGTSDLTRAIDEHEPGEKVRVTVVRDGDERTLTLTLGQRPS